MKGAVIMIHNGANGPDLIKIIFHFTHAFPSSYAACHCLRSSSFRALARSSRSFCSVFQSWSSNSNWTVTPDGTTFLPDSTMV